MFPIFVFPQAFFLLKLRARIGQRDGWTGILELRNNNAFRRGWWPLQLHSPARCRFPDDANVLFRRERAASDTPYSERNENRQRRRRG